MICFVSKIEVCDVILVTLLASLTITVSVTMADSGHFRPPLRLNVHEPNLADSFQKWKRELEVYMVATEKINEFPRWPRTNAFDLIKLDLIGRIYQFCCQH